MRLMASGVISSVPTFWSFAARNHVFSGCEVVLEKIVSLPSRSDTYLWVAVIIAAEVEELIALCYQRFPLFFKHSFDLSDVLQG